MNGGMGGMADMSGMGGMPGMGGVGPGKYCLPRHPTQCEPSCLELNGIL